MTRSTAADPSHLARVLEALADPACREIIAELDDPKTGPSLDERCGVSRSTLYRKLERLSACGVVEERIEIEPDFGHTTRYSVAIDECRISVDDVRRIASREDDPTGERREPTSDVA